MKISLSDHFTYKKLIHFVTASVIMLIFTSVYGLVDGLFVSNFAGKTPFAAVNLIMPFIMILGAFGFTVGTGGSAVISKTLGEGKSRLANEYFTMLTIVSATAGAVFGIAGIVLLRPICVLLGAEGEMIDMCVVYGRIILAALPLYMLQNVFQAFFITAEKPKLGLAVTVAAGVLNMVLDYVLVAVIPLGIVGAASATAISQIVGGLVPVIYFFTKNNSLLRFTKTRLYPRVLLKTCTNGSSELMTNLSMSLVNMLYNVQLMRIAGEDGIAAYGVIMYVNFIFQGVFIGYSLGAAPIIGYNYGAKNYDELKNMFKKSLVITGVSGVVLTAAAIMLAPVLAGIFVGYDSVLCEMTVHGFAVFSLSFLTAGFNIFGSAFFTALNNGLVSAAISFLRTLLFQLVSIAVLPVLFGIDGIWASVVAAECAALAVTAVFFVRLGPKYSYM